MISRLCFSFVLIVSFFDVPLALAMHRSKELQSPLAVLEAQMADQGYVPSMGRVPVSCSVQSTVAQTHECMPSGRCDGSCYTAAHKEVIKAMIDRKRELPEGAAEQVVAMKQLKNLLRQIVKSVGKTEAIKIANQAIAESESDSDDTQSSESLNSPTDSCLDKVIQRKE